MPDVSSQYNIREAFHICWEITGSRNTGRVCKGWFITERLLAGQFGAQKSALLRAN